MKTKYIYLILSVSSAFFQEYEKKTLIIFSLLEITLEVEDKYSEKETAFMFSRYTNLKLHMPAPVYPGQIVYPL